MGAKIGGDFKAYYNSGTHASPTWVLLGQIGDLTLDMGVNLAEVMIREVDWDLSLAATKTAAIDFDLLYNRGNTAFDFLQNIFVNKIATQFAIMDDAIATATTEGLRAFCIIERFPIEQPRKNTAKVAVRLALAYAEESSAVVTPSWYVISA